MVREKWATIRGRVNTTGQQRLDCEWTAVIEGDCTDEFAVSALVTAVCGRIEKLAYPKVGLGMASMGLWPAQPLWPPFEDRFHGSSLSLQTRPVEVFRLSEA
jgi:hypothetical protein